MKISEIINEDVSASEQLSSSSLSANLVPVLMFLRNRSEDKELTPKLRTDSLIRLVKNAGDVTFDYETLVAAHESDEAVKELIKSFNENEVILKSDFDTDDDNEMHGDESNVAQNPEDTVDQMAKRATNKRM